MSDSDKLTRLKERIESLGNVFLPPVSRTGSYDQREFDSTAAFLLMAHAEVEEFIEQRCLEVADAVVTKWSVDSRPRSALIALAAFSHSQGDKALPTPDELGRSKIRDVLDEAKRSYSHVVNQNNGVKAHDLLRLLIPIGIRESQISNKLVIDLNNFGATRGQLAHNTNAIQNAPDPVANKKLVDDIVSELGKLDSHLSRLESEDPPVEPC